MNHRSALSSLKKHSNPKKVKTYSGFFKTGIGFYGAGDIFWGISVAENRSVANQFLELSLSEILKLLRHPVHEARLLSLLILVEKFKKAEEEAQKEMYLWYIKNAQFVNNWDLVDLSAPKIVGVYLLHRDKKILYKLAKSKNLWEKRIAIVATYYFIREKKFSDTLKISEILLLDKHDLIHKAVGWMLREVGKRDLKTEVGFLDKHYKIMPRTMLRYAIERFPEKLRRKYLGK